MSEVKEWKKVNTMEYSFLVDNNQIGSLEMLYDKWNRSAVFKIEAKTYIMKYDGFWRSNIQIEDENGVVILKTYSKKWFSSVSIIEYKNKKWLLKIRNNPMAEYVVFDGEKEILGYGLDTEIGKASVRINSNSESTDWLFDFLLWYLFVPIAQENMGDNFVFQTLMMNQ